MELTIVYSNLKRVERIVSIKQLHKLLANEKVYRIIDSNTAEILFERKYF